MSLTVEQRVEGLRSRVSEMSYWVDRAWIGLDAWTIDGRPIAAGQPWPAPADLVRFAHPAVRLPADWPLEESYLVLDLGGEGLVTLRHGDTATAFGLDPNHRRFPVPAREFAVEAEVVPRLPFGEPVRRPVLAAARLVWIDPAVEPLVRLLRMLEHAVTALAAEPVAEALLTAAERALAGLAVWPSATAAYLSRLAGSEDMQRVWALPADLELHPTALSPTEQDAVRDVTEQLQREVLALREHVPPQGAIDLVGHAHTDLAWLWPLAETRRKARRTFNTVLNLMQRFPEFRFNQSSAQLYAFVQEDDPDLFARVRAAVEGGQWEPIGGMWVEPDINMPCGESLARQLLYGQRYFQQQFGRTHSVCWLPDCFGFSPGLPQLLRSAGIEYFFTIKLTWSETNTFPYDLFWWEGLDGSRVLAHMFNNPGHGSLATSGYNADPEPLSVVQTWRNFRGKRWFGESLLSAGFGDGGGGPTPEMIEQVRVLDTFPALPRLQFVEVREVFERMGAAVAGADLPTWNGELYLELHRGTLTSQGRTKWLHRRAERDLVAAEVAASLAHLLGGPAPASLEDHWRVLLRNEFHDILPGSSIREVYEVTERELSGVVEAADAAIDEALTRIGEQAVAAGGQPALLLVNPDLSERPLRVESEQELDGAQAVEQGWVLATDETVPALGLTVTTGGTPADGVRAGERELENRYLRVRLGADGTVAEIWDRRAQRDVLAGRGNQLWVYADKPREWDAWDVDASYRDAGEEVTDVQSLTVLEAGPHRAALRIVRCWRDSTITQEIRLWANSPRLEFRTTLDWHDRRRLLKARFPVAVRAASARFETAFGLVERPTHRNTSWDEARFEVAGHRWVDLAEPGYGVALLNDGKYGHDVVGNVLGISLLRSPLYPDPLADEGRQTFTYALLPHAGDWLDGGVLMEAEDLNRPLLARPVKAAGAARTPVVELGGLPLGLGALKAREDGDGLVWRVYEPRGARGQVSPRLPSGWVAEADLDLLENSVGDPNWNFLPFQMRTWLLRKD